MRSDVRGSGTPEGSFEGVDLMKCEVSEPIPLSCQEAFACAVTCTLRRRTRNIPRSRSCRRSRPRTCPCRTSRDASPSPSIRTSGTRPRASSRRPASRSIPCRHSIDIRRSACSYNPTRRQGDKATGGEQVLMCLRVSPSPCQPFFSSFFQSARNFSIPMSVRGCFASWSMTLKGIVAMCAPAMAASTTWSGFRMLATITSVA
jgi:hypothetical protein